MQSPLTGHHRGFWYHRELLNSRGHPRSTCLACLPFCVALPDAELRWAIAALLTVSEGLDLETQRNQPHLRRLSVPTLLRFIFITEYKFTVLETMLQAFLFGLHLHAQE